MLSDTKKGEQELRLLICKLPGFFLNYPAGESSLELSLPGTKVPVPSLELSLPRAKVPRMELSLQGAKVPVIFLFYTLSLCPLSHQCVGTGGLVLTSNRQTSSVEYHAFGK